ncbi:hypothetical protein ACTWP5_02505 [Streptomyces sp. 4N509B]|uniref:hypothetical protein n=1 Tax=Streptomyces sp. 4N509B TaxID=3457413 RepID=UPI003FD5BBFD
MKGARNVLATVATLGVVLAAPVALASPAHAAYEDCTRVVANAGYFINDTIRDGCRYGEQGSERLCQDYLLVGNVDDGKVRLKACNVAS